MTSLQQALSVGFALTLSVSAYKEQQEVHANQLES
jgi:hypothetical protein